MTDYTYKTNDIFKPGEHDYLNACVGTNGGPYGYFDYSLGYFESARILKQAAIDEKFTVDIAVYPIVYNYRHAIELAIKHLLISIPLTFGEEKDFKPTHDLKKLWVNLKPYLLQDESFYGKDEIEVMELIVNDISQFDPSAEVFRFPTTKDGDFHLQDVEHINLGVLGDWMEMAREILEYWYFAYQQVLDRQDEVDYIGQI